jgi:hypothetical protein
MGRAQLTDTSATARQRRRRLVVIRVVGALAIVGIAATTALDWLSDFWIEHPMATAYTSALLMLVLGIAVINEYLAARSRRRWHTVAALAITDLRDSTRDFADELASAVGVTDATAGGGPERLRQFLEEAEDLGRSTALADLARSTISDEAAGRALRTRITGGLARAQPIAVRWAPVMIGDGEYVGELDEYVDLLNRVWRVSWALSPAASRGGRAAPPTSAIAEQLADAIVDMLAFQARLTVEIRHLLPWPESFGPAPEPV